MPFLTPDAYIFRGAIQRQTAYGVLCARQMARMESFGRKRRGSINLAEVAPYGFRWKDNK